MRTQTFVLFLIVTACRDRDPYANAPAHRGEPTVQQRGRVVDTLSREVRFLNRMLEHQQRLWGLLRQANARDLSFRTQRIIEDADSQRMDMEADLLATLEKYRGVGALRTNATTGSLVDGLKQLRGAEYEKALLSTLISEYRKQIAESDSFLPHLSADVKGLAKQIRSQRRHEIDKLIRE